MKNLFRVLPFFIFLTISTVSFCQNNTGLTKKDSLAPILTADSLASGNYKDIFLSFYQLALNNLTGPNKEFKFTSNPYAILLKNNPALANDDYYQKYKYWRKLNFSIDALMDSAYHFNGLSVGINYALVNHRDITLGTIFKENYFAHITSDFQYRTLHSSVDSAIQELSISDKKKEDTLKGQLDSLFGDYKLALGHQSVNYTLERRIMKAAKELGIDSLQKNSVIWNRMQQDTADFKLLYNKVSAEIPDMPSMILKDNLSDQLEQMYYGDPVLIFDKIDPVLKSIILQKINENHLDVILDAITKDKSLNFHDQLNKGFLSLKDQFKTRGLLTAGISDTTYPNGNLFKAVQVSIEWLKGVTNDSTKKLTFELDIKGTANFLRDSLISGNNLRRQYWNIEPGINMVVRNNNLESFFELKLSGAVNYIFNGTYKDEKALDITLNGTMRLRVFNELWIPVQFKYDPKNGNVFGFITITSNFTGLKSLLTGSKTKG